MEKRLQTLIPTAQILEQQYHEERYRLQLYQKEIRNVEEQLMYGWAHPLPHPHPGLGPPRDTSAPGQRPRLPTSAPGRRYERSRKVAAEEKSDKFERRAEKAELLVEQTRVQLEEEIKAKVEYRDESARREKYLREKQQVDWRERARARAHARRRVF